LPAAVAPDRDSASRIKEPGGSVEPPGVRLLIEQGGSVATMIAAAAMGMSSVSVLTNSLRLQR